MINIASLFDPASISRRLQVAPTIRTPVMDIVFKERVQWPLATITADMVSNVVHELPLIRRGSPSIPATERTGQIELYEPFPIRPNDAVTAAELNNIRNLDASSREAWATVRQELLRKVVRKTTEALCAVSLSGTLSWPVRLETGQFDTYTVVYGSPLSVTPDKLLDDPGGVKTYDIFVILTAMHEKLEEYGYGSEVEIWADSLTYGQIFKIAEASSTTAKIKIEVGKEGIYIGNYLIKRRAEKYRNPETGATAPIMPAKTLRMLALDANFMLPYCAVDDIDGNLRGMPFFIKAIPIQDPSGVRLVAEAKPFPLPNMKGICDAVVLE